MDQSQLIALLASLGGLIVFILWGISFRRSFEPQQGEYYVLQLFGWHLFVICINDPRFQWFQKLKFYILFWPFKIAIFWYQWVEEMTYTEYLEKKEIAKVTKNYDARIEWQPQYRQDELIAQGPSELIGTPLDKTVRILVARKEKMKSLKKIEAYSFVAPFETSNNFRGSRIFTLYLEIEDMSTPISRIHNWQKAASQVFSTEFTAWSKKVSYTKFLETTIEQLKIALGTTDGSFLDEINENLQHLKFKISRAEAGPVYLNLESRDMLESQEEEEKAANRLAATQKDAQGKKALADALAYEIKQKGIAEAAALEQKGIAEANNAKKMGEAEAANVELIGTAEVGVLSQKTKTLQKFVQNTNQYSVQQIKAKYGESGIAGLQGVYLENSGENHNINIPQLTNHIIGDEIQKIRGGQNEEAA
jgi:hypothetical protein